ncbi:DUF3558 family protein [Saccharothrix lopnurensis]|uniref:DUF3558 family protein n=1 Tax=Saccharothrix lopnurensis TaxID=1670621 RepID=A0ABW1PHK9_9PSEU
MKLTTARLAIAGFAGLSLLATACSTNEPGEPTPRSTGTTAGSAAAPGDNALAGVKPCDLLTDAEVSGLGLTPPGSPDDLAGKEICEWKVSGNGGLSVGAEAAVDDLGLDRAATSPIKVGEYDAVREQAPNGAAYLCTVAIEVTESASMVVISNLTAGSTDTAAACARATDAAELIAPKLP